MGLGGFIYIGALVLSLGGFGFLWGFGVLIGAGAFGGFVWGFVGFVSGGLLVL